MTDKGETKMDLSGATKAELLAELERREREDRDRAGVDYYFYFYLVDDPDSDSNEGIVYFAIVFKRWWHSFHCLEDRHIARRLVLPVQFAEVVESIFEFVGDAEDGTRLLSSHGYTQLDPAPIP
jgi:hypothetical protein